MLICHHVMRLRHHRNMRLEQILNLISRGLGISVMPASYSLSLPANVRFITLPYRTSLYAVWRKQNEDAALQNLITFAFPQRQ